MRKFSKLDSIKDTVHVNDLFDMHMFEYSTAITENQQPFDKDLHSVGQLILFQLSTNYDNTYACICQQLCGFIK